MCRRFGKSPSEYLFNDLQCTHSKLAIDMTIYNVWSHWKVEETKKQQNKARLKHANAQ